MTESPATGSDAGDAVTVIVPSKQWRFLNLREVWRYRELLFFLTWRDVKVRYKQTILGGLWAILQPLLMMVAFTFVFTRLGNVQTGGVPYPVFAFAGLLPWTFFANSISQGTNSVVVSQNLITKIFFPRVILPGASMGAAFFDFAIAFVMLLALMLWYGVGFHTSLLLLPALILALVIAASGFVVLLSSLAVAYRDVRHIITFAMQIWLFATPSIYTSIGSMNLSRSTTLLLALNPAQGIILNFRAAVLGGAFDVPSLLISLSSALTILAIAGLYFRRVERKFADII